jgi:hypothetical protein
MGRVWQSVVLFSFVAVIAGCANPKVQEVQAYSAYAKQQAEAGNMSWTEFYTSMYDKTLTLPSSNSRNAALKGYAELIPIGRQYDAKQISKNQFEDARRMVITRVDSEVAANQDRDRKELGRSFADMMDRQAADRQRQQRSTTTCNTSVYGNNATTTCY